MSFDIRLQSRHWSRLRLAVSESGNTCWLWLPTWATSTSTLLIGTWKRRRNLCATSLWSPRTLCRGDDHDLPRSAHGGIPSRASGPTPWRQPTHVRFIRLQLSVFVRVCLPETQSGAVCAYAGAVGLSFGQQFPGTSGDQTRQLGGDTKYPPGCHPVVLSVSAAP